jgi:2-isopropylmalate synthase
VCLEHEGKHHRGTAVGDGPAEAAFRAIQQITDVQVQLKDYRVASNGQAGDGQVQVSVELEHGNRSYRGEASGEQVSASARAFLEVINRIRANWGRRRIDGQPRSAL